MLTIRPSSLNSYNDCPKRTCVNIFYEEIKELGYEFRERTNNIGAVVGTGLHKGIAYINGKKIKHEPYGEEDFKEISIVSLKDGIAKGVSFDSTSPNRDTAEKQLLTIATQYKKKIEPLVKPVMFETRLSAKIANEYGFDIILSGTPDAITAEAIRDTKTGVVFRNCDIQLGCYGILAKANNINITELLVDYLPRMSLKKPYVVPQTTRYRLSLCVKRALVTMDKFIREAHLFFESGDVNIISDNTASMLCSEKYCIAFGTDFCEISKYKR